MAKNKGAPETDAALEDDWQGLIADAKGAVGAEAAFQIARAKAAGKVVGKIAGLAGLALVLLFFAMMALVVGLLLALAPTLGVWGALGAVAGGLLLTIALTGLGLWLAIRRLKRMLAIGKMPGEGA